MDAELLVFARSHDLRSLEATVLGKARSEGRTLELLRSSYSAGADRTGAWPGTEVVRTASAGLEPGWWARSQKVALVVDGLPVEQSRARANFVAEEILAGHLTQYDGLRWAWALAPYDQPEARAAILRLLEDPQLDLGRMKGMLGVPNKPRVLWWGLSLPNSSSGSELLGSILSSDKVPFEVRVRATKWFDPQLPNSLELAGLAYEILMDPARPLDDWEQSPALGSVAAVLLRGGDAQRVLTDIEQRSYTAFSYESLIDFAAADPAVGTAKGLANRLLRDPECSYVQQDAVRLIAGAGGDEARGLLLDALAGAGEEARPEIRERLGDLERQANANAIPAAEETARVRNQLLDWIAENRPGKAQAIQSLGAVGTVSDLPLLIQLTQDPDLSTHSAATSALKALNTRLTQGV